MCFCFPQLISSVDPVFLKLTPVDNEIYKKYKEKFSNLKLDLLNEDEIKSESSKFVSIFKKQFF